MEKVGFGIIGAGAIAAVHAEAVTGCANAKLKAVYDPDRNRAETLAARFGCRGMSDWGEFLGSGIEAVTVATPSGLHAEAALPAARAGKHILCEKPLEVNTEKADELIRTCRECGVLLSVVLQSRFCRAVQRIRRAVEEGRFGEPVLASASVRWFRAPDYYASGGWRGSRALDGGGALMNQGIHTVDLLLHFNGDVAEVDGRAARRLHRGIEVEDTVAAMLRFRNGSLGTIEASTACLPGLPRRVALSGTRGSAILEDDRIVLWRFDTEQPEDAAIRDFGGEGMHGGSADPGAITGEGHRRQVAELAVAIRTGRPLLAPGSEGRRSVALINAVYRSAETGSVVCMES